jgi:xanthine dehydrogenase accessory factor
MAQLILVRGVGDVGSAVAHALYLSGHAVAVHDVLEPTTSRRGMAFTDAVFDGKATLVGVVARRVDSLDELSRSLASREFLPVTTIPFATILELPWDALVDSRMRKRDVPEDQRHLAPLTIGLGPNFTAGGNVDVAIETHWDDLGRVIRVGATRPLEGEPRPIEGVGRERFIYAPVAGVFRTEAQLGDVVATEAVIAEIDGVRLLAPIEGSIRAVTHDGTTVALGAKVIEIDPRGGAQSTYGLGERPRRIAEGVLSVIASSLAVG